MSLSTLPPPPRSRDLVGQLVDKEDGEVIECSVPLVAR